MNRTQWRIFLIVTAPYIWLWGTLKITPNPCRTIPYTIKAVRDYWNIMDSEQP